MSDEVDGVAVTPPLDPAVARERLAAVEPSQPVRRPWTVAAIGVVACLAVALVAVRPWHHDAPPPGSGSRVLRDALVELDSSGNVVRTIPRLGIDTSGSAVRPDRVRRTYESLYALAPSKPTVEELVALVGMT